MKKTLYIIGLSITIFLSTVINQQLSAQTNGSLDNTFGIGGKVMTPVGNNDVGANAVAIQSDGKIVTAGWSYNGIDDDFAIVRYNTNGTLDNTFGTSGVVIANPSGSTDNAYSVVIQGDGKIVIAGTEELGANFDFAVQRYNSDGTIDNSFGTAGNITTDINGGDDRVFSTALQSDGKIVVAGISFNGTNYDFAVARYNTNGTLDNTFGTGGKIITSISNSDDKAYSVVIQPDGKIIVTGSCWNGSNYDFAVVRYNTLGIPDNTFGTSGIVKTDINNSDDFAYAAALQSNGKIVVTGTSATGNGDFIVVRYNTDGTLDNNFGTSGKAITDFNGNDDEPYAVVINGNGKIFVAGFSHISGSNIDIAVASYNTNGTLDNTFGTGGKVTTSVGTADDWAYSMALQSDGKIVVAGYSVDGSDNNDISLVRYFVTSTGINDVVNQNDNVIIYPNPAENNITVKTLAQSKDDIVSIYNIQGQLIQQELLNVKAEINISNLEKGVYFINISNTETTIVKRFVKE